MNEVIPLVKGFTDLFQGNRRAVGTEQGKCHWLLAEEDWDLFLEAHLRAKRLIGDEHLGEPIGVYPMHHRQKMYADWWEVHWGCIDFDTGEDESWAHAQNLRRVLEAFDIYSWVERSRSKGFHVWVFLDDWVSAEVVRHALLAACQIVDAPTKEINPKQTALVEGQVGNYVRLPYPGHLGDNGRNVSVTHRVMLDPDKKWFSLPQFVERALHYRVAPVLLDPLEKLYLEPVRPIPRRDWTVPLEGEAVDRLRGKTRTIWENGPLEGSDRSDTLWKLARYLHEDGRHTRAEALELLRDADSRWGKFAGRADCDVRLNSLLDRAWGDRP